MIFFMKSKSPESCYLQSPELLLAITGDIKKLLLARTKVVTCNHPTIDSLYRIDSKGVF